jgi:hypothetical protein
LEGISYSDEENLSFSEAGWNAVKLTETNEKTHEGVTWGCHQHKNANNLNTEI